MAGLYVHVPFRRKRRSFDDAYYTTTDRSDFSGFATALKQELRYYARQHALEESLTTLYVGGGRPSLLPIETVESVHSTITEVFQASALQESTFEVNPSDVERGYLATLRRLKFDRVSIEVLSFSPSDLEAVAAPHTTEDITTALQTARQVGMENISVDLLFGWPQHPFTNWKTSLQQAVDLEIPHITLIEAPTSEDDHRGKIEQVKRLEYAMAFLRDEGYDQYELTHFSRPDFRSLHQENYYSHGNNLGMGPGAQTFWWVDRSENLLARRWSNVNDVKQYADLLDERYPPVAYRQTLDRTALAREYLLLRLRTKAGIDLDVLENQYGYDLQSSHRALLDRFKEEGLIYNDDSKRIRLTDRGLLVADGITERLFPE